MKRSIILSMAILAALLSLIAVNAHATLFTVDALTNSAGGGVGLNTGITLSTGQVFTVSAGVNDLWSAGALPRFSNADGFVGTLFATGSDESGQLAGTKIGANFGTLTQNGLSAPFGALVGDINGTFFMLGTSFSGPAPNSGTLLLFYWDSNFADNSGSVLVNVSTATAAVPEPGSLFLLGSALAGLLAGRRKQYRSAAS